MRRMWVIAALVAVLSGCGKREQAKEARPPVFEPVQIVTAYVPLIERPETARALLVGDEARALTNYLSHAGVACTTEPDGASVDLIVVSEEEMSSRAWEKLCGRLAPEGVAVWILDVADESFGHLWDRINAFALKEAHIWMPGSERWVLVGRRTDRTVALSDMLEVFTREAAFGDLARARGGSLPEIFACYLGTREEILPAFHANDDQATVRPECFYTKTVPQIRWMSSDGVDRDIARQVLSEIRSLQVIRRLAVKGGMAVTAAKDRKDEEEATAMLARALRRNPHEFLILERLERLERNARGFLSVGKLLMAMKCFETMVLICPEDAAAVHNFGMCLKKLGKLDMAEKVLARAEAVARAKGDAAGDGNRKKGDADDGRTTGAR